MYWTYREKFWDFKRCPLYRGCPYSGMSTIGDFTVLRTVHDMR